MRLIDADANRDDFMARVYDILSDETDNIKANSIIDAFDGMQTAYDPDKVVEQLEDRSMWKELLVYEMTHREREIVKRAIEIMKGGEKNADTKRGKRKN